MKAYLVNIETRKNDRDNILGPFTTFEAARAAFIEEYDWWTEEKWRDYTKYGSDFDKGLLYTEELSVEIIERELK